MSTYIHSAAATGDMEGISSFLNKYGRGNIDVINSYDDCTALMEAVWHGQDGTAALLLEMGAGVNVRNKRGITALMLAAWHGKDGLAALLLENGADVNAENNAGETALMAGAFSGAKGVIALLLEKGGNINDKDNSGDTALIWAANFSKEAAVSILLESGADINVKGKYGMNALSIARQRKHEVITNMIERWPVVLKQRKDEEERQLAEDLAAIEKVFKGGFRRIPRPGL